MNPGNNEENTEGVDQTLPVTRWVLPAALATFFALYLFSLVSGISPELGLIQAGVAGIVLAILGRVAIKILEATPPPPEPVEDDPLLSDELTATLDRFGPNETAELLAALDARRQGRE